MIYNYLKTALRNILRNSGYALINVLGLSIGLACFILLYLFLKEEAQFDTFHSKSDQIYRLVELFNDPQAGEQHTTLVPAPMGSSMASDFPEVRQAVSIIQPGQAVSTIDQTKTFNSRDYFFVTENFFTLFDFELLIGDPSAVLKEPNTVVLAQSTAKAYFGEENPVGKVFNFNRIGDLQVSGVVADPPTNSHLQFGMLISYNSFLSHEGWKRYLESWDENIAYTYLELEEHTDVQHLSAQLPDFVETYRKGQWEERQVYLQALSDVHFHSSRIEFGIDNQPGSLTYFYIFLIIGIFILVIGCINYMNLATARSVYRAREIGIRKVVGAHRNQLIIQFLGESVFMAFLAMAFSLLFVDLALPYFNSIALKSLVFTPLNNPSLVLTVIGITLLIGLVSGSLPALYLSGFKPVAVLKGQFRSGLQGIRLRQGLVVFQFMLSIGMTIATIVVYNQLRFVRNTELGFDKEHLVVLDINSGKVRQQFQAMKTEFGKIPQVIQVAATSRVPGEWKNITETAVKPISVGTVDSLQTYFFCFDEHAIETLAMEIVAGNNFSGNIAADTNGILINETAARQLGWEDPVGKVVAIGGRRQYQPKVIGVVKDFHFQSLHKEIAPLIIGAWNNPVSSIDYFAIRVTGNNTPETIRKISEVHATFDPETPVEYHFLDQQIELFYQAEARAGKIFTFGAFLTVFIACLGLFGLAAFTVEQRTREISIRKILGASVPDLLLLLSRQFMFQVLIAFLIVSPIAWYFMEQWLQGFSYRISVGFGTFFLAGFIALFIALLTVSYRSFKAAVANPAESLNYE